MKLFNTHGLDRLGREFQVGDMVLRSDKNRMNARWIMSVHDGYVKTSTSDPAKYPEITTGVKTTDTFKLVIVHRSNSNEFNI